MNSDRKRDGGAADANLMRYIWAHTKRQQVWILVIVLLSLPTYFLALDLPKLIINGPIQGMGFPTPDATQTFLRISLPVPHWISAQGSLLLFPGLELSRSGMLVGLSGLFLLLVIVNGLFKLYINTFKGKLGERMLRRLRHDLIDRVLRFPIPRFRRVKSPEIATMIKDEVEPLGPFIADSYVQPLYLGGQALTALIFIIVQDLWLGLMAAGIVALQTLIIPKLRRRLIVLAKERQLAARELAGRVGEIVDGIHTIRVNDTSHYERADISARLGRIYWIRFQIYQWKFLVKFLNNFLAQLTPFLFYAVGGFLVLRGRLDVGQLVAVVAAYRDLPSPIKELIDWDQQRVDAQVKYAQVMQQFGDKGLLDAKLQEPVRAAIAPVCDPIAVSNLAVVDEAGTKLIERATLTLRLNERVAVLGRDNVDSEALADALARLLAPSSGRISLGKVNLQDLPESTTGRRLAYAGPEGFLPQASVRETLLYVLKRVPVREPAYDAAAQKMRDRELAEAGHAGNSLLDIRADWIDYAAAGARDDRALLGQLRRVTRIAGLNEDILNFGLRGMIDPERQPERAARIVAARKELRRRLSTSEFEGLVQPFEPETYNLQATVSENLLFGTAVDPAFSDASLAGNPYLQQVLARSGLDVALFEMGREIAATTIEMFEDLPPEHPFFEQLTFMEADHVPSYKAILQSIRDKSVDAIDADERRAIVSLSFAYVEPRHRMGLLDAPLCDRILAARSAFRLSLPEHHKDAIEFYDPDRYNKAAALQDNILFGRIAHGVAGGRERVLAAVRSLLHELGLEELVFDAGLDFNIGHGGTRLSAAQRQKIGVARALLKRPDYAIFKQPLSTLNVEAQEEIIREVLNCSRDAAQPFGVLWVTSTPRFAHLFDKVALFERGVLVEFGPPAQLATGGGSAAKLLAHA